ncbi:hypothetical protein BKA67DRAFT_529090 [Truncatella angustata]|uniref:Uncharacterized protein n=1 Tax=Truncatella angustata TaxID=152316 RepID=A0A9P8UV48_9PEZI|nr:uncharacterized protein BKA67DRAFT_529090 [Truncatella angustata]KAH6658900.1 hypothetical protein BKA67DRAFT_529090 [Truncatella angustata]
MPELLWGQEGSRIVCKAASALRPESSSDGTLRSGHTLNALQKAVRLSALMCLRSPTIEVVYGRQSYTALLTQLYDQLQAVHSWLLESITANRDQAVANALPILFWMGIIVYNLSTYF